MPSKLLLFSKKETKSNLCTNLYHELKKRNEKINWKTLKRNWKGNKTFLSDLKEKIEKQNETNRHWKKTYTQRKIFHNMLYEHKICMQNAAFLMCLIEACNTKKISVTPLFRYRGHPCMTSLHFPQIVRPLHSPLNNCFHLFLNFLSLPRVQLGVMSWKLWRNLWKAPSIISIWRQAVTMDGPQQ